MNQASLQFTSFLVALVILHHHLQPTLAQRNPIVGGAQCRWDLDCANGRCISGKCQCFTGYVCDRCQILSLDYAPALGCPTYIPPPVPPIGNAECVGNIGCSLKGECNPDTKRCKCYDGYVCADCKLTVAEYASGRRCTKPPPLPPNGGGACTATKDCFNHGSCVNGACVCNKDYYCTNCQIRGDIYDAAIGCPSANTTNTVGGGFCWDQNSCNNAGSCDSNVCTCYNGYMCSNCQMRQSDWEQSRTCAEYRLPPSPLSAIEGGGANCTDSSECNSAKSGGSCMFGQCVCNTGFKCGRCSMLQWQIDEVKRCADVGGEPCTENSHCKFRGVCNKQTRRCECYGGYYCANCEYTVEQLQSGKSCKEMSSEWPSDSSSASALCPTTFLIWDLFLMMALVLLGKDDERVDVDRNR